MTRFEARYDKLYTSRVMGRDFKITTWEKIASIINSAWIYSRYWKNDTWVEQAKVDLAKRVSYVEEDLRELREAKRMLDSIEDE